MRGWTCLNLLFSPKPLGLGGHSLELGQIGLQRLFIDVIALGQIRESHARVAGGDHPGDGWVGANSQHFAVVAACDQDIESALTGDLVNLGGLTALLEAADDLFRLYVLGE